jgi:hypothetical protein
VSCSRELKRGKNSISDQRDLAGGLRALARQLRIGMQEMPTVWRPVVIPGRTSCEALHYVTQDAMGRQPYHLLKFSSSDDPTHCTDSLGEHG